MFWRDVLTRRFLCNSYHLWSYRNSFAAKQKRGGTSSGSAASRSIDCRFVNVRPFRIRCLTWFCKRLGAFVLAFAHDLRIQEA
jgi:hypothetical protein